MSQEEYYIRTPDNDEARGPYRIDQLQSLGDANKLDRETLIYDETMEVWIEIGKHETLCEAVFPQRKKLTLKTGEQKKTSAGEGSGDTKEESDPLQTTESSDTDAEGNELPTHDGSEMLLAAEGQTEDTEHLKRKQERQNAAASMSLPGLGVIMLLSAFVLIYPNGELIRDVINEEAEYFTLMKPMILLGGLDLIFGIFLLLAVSEIFPAIRLRAALGLGFWGFVFWAGGDPTLMAIGILGHLSLFVCTMTLNLYLMMAGLATGVACFGLLGFLAYNGSLFFFL